ncbi:MAG TPA: hypothetical protein VMS71_06990 [Candidatus Acidoferrum sp.]|nr:hypothetical protein [Candidatus Acidoferrum sp.]
MDASQWMQTILFGGILGMLGQGIRVIVGLKKVNDQASQARRAFGELFETSSLLVSLLIGFVAGSLAVIGISSGDTGVKPDKQMVLTLLGAGYAGADFVEGFVKKYMPSEAGKVQSTETPQHDQPAVG